MLEVVVERVVEDYHKKDPRKPVVGTLVLGSLGLDSHYLMMAAHKQVVDKQVADNQVVDRQGPDSLVLNIQVLNIQVVNILVPGSQELGTLEPDKQALGSQCQRNRKVDCSRSEIADYWKLEERS